MKKEIIKRGLLGIPVGITIGYLMTIINSLIFGNGNYYPVTPELVASMGNEINAVMLQSLLYAVIGFSFASSSVVWNMDSWSMLKQTALYFIINAVVMMPIAYGLNWMQHNSKGIIIYLAVFTLYFAVIWLIQYFIWKRYLKRMNTKLADR